MSEEGVFKLCAMGMDENDRSFTKVVEIKLHKVDEMESISEKQSASYWGLAFNLNSELTNEYEMHLTNQARIVGVMSGAAEIMQQDGSVCRLGPGDFIAVHGRALHHSTMRSPVPTQTLNVTFSDTGDFNFK
jgi:hypothetical protein